MLRCWLRLAGAARFTVRPDLAGAGIVLPRPCRTRAGPTATFYSPRMETVMSIGNFVFLKHTILAAANALSGVVALGYAF